MNRRLIKIALFTLLIGSLVSFYSDLYAQGNKPKYVIGAGDVIEVSVWNHPELKREMSIRPDGWISFPLTGEVQASGITPAELSDQIHQKLLKYMKDPIVSVIVVKYGSKKVLVLGEIKKPGLYQYEGGMTAFDAIGLAEGYNKHAELRSILVVRNVKTNPKHPEFHLANLYKAIHDSNTAENIMLEAYDIVYVPKSFIGKLGDFIDYIILRIRPADESYYLYELAK